MVRFLRGNGRFCSTLFRDEDPRDEVDDKTGAKGDEGDDCPDESYHGRIDIKVLPEAPADAPEYPFVL